MEYCNFWSLTAISLLLVVMPAVFFFIRLNDGKTLVTNDVMICYWAVITTTFLLLLLPSLLSTHADRQGVDISVTVCLFLFVCVFVMLRISPARTKLAASNFARWFLSILGRESHILGNFAPPEAQNLPANWAAHALNDK